MSFRAIKVGRRYEVSVLGITFPATVRKRIAGHNGHNLVHIEPDNPSRITYRFVTPRRIVKELA